MKRLLLLIPLLFFISSCTYSKYQVKVDLDKVDSQLFNDIKRETRKDDAEIYQALGMFYLKQGNWDRSINNFKRATSLNPNLYLSWYNLGLLHLDTEEGYGYFKKAIEANSAYPPHYYWLAYSYCREKRDKEAIPIFEKYLEVAKDDSNESGRYEYAREVLKELILGTEGENLSKTRRIASQ